MISLVALIKRLFSMLKSLFLQGLFTLLPITATIFFAQFTYNLISSWVHPLRPLTPHFLQQLPAAELLLVILFILCVGILLKVLVINPIIDQLENVIKKIPLLSTVYSASKTVVQFFNVPAEEAKKAKKVVLVEYPKKNCYSIGFMLESSQHSFQRIIPADKREGHEMVKVFIPSSPAPTTGYFLIVPRSSVIDTPITFEEAIKAIVSCGLINPESLHKIPFTK